MSPFISANDGTQVEWLTPGGLGMAWRSWLDQVWPWRWRVCGATDGAGLVGDGPDDLDEPYGRCTLDAGHDGDWHQEWRGGKLWAEWRGPHPGQRCGICGKDGSEH